MRVLSACWATAAAPYVELYRDSALCDDMIARKSEVCEFCYCDRDFLIIDYVMY